MWGAAGLILRTEATRMTGKLALAAGERIKAGRIIRNATTKRPTRWDQALVEPRHTSMSVSRWAQAARRIRRAGEQTNVRLKRRLLLFADLS